MSCKVLHNTIEMSSLGQQSIDKVEKQIQLINKKNEQIRPKLGVMVQNGIRVI